MRIHVGYEVAVEAIYDSDEDKIVDVLVYTDEFYSSAPIHFFSTDLDYFPNNNPAPEIQKLHLELSKKAEAAVERIETVMGEHHVRFVHKPEPCDCLDGVLWPMATNGDSSRDWIERCDECRKYEDDIAAALALAERLGVDLCFTKHPTVSGLRPYIEKKEET